MGAPRYRPEHYDWMQAHAATGNFTSDTFEAFKREFPGVATSRQAVRMFRDAVVKGGQRFGGIPESPVANLAESIVRINASVALVTSDYQVPYHDEDFIRFAFDLAQTWGATHHVMNGDIYDLASISKFNAMLPGQRVSVGEELELGGKIIEHSTRIFEETIFIPANHEWRLLVALLRGELLPEQAQRLLAAGDKVRFSPLSYVILNDTIRITHPTSASILPTSVGRALAEKHHAHVIVGHGHGIGYSRSYGGHYTVVETGGMFASSRMDYLMTADKRRPQVNQGFAMVEDEHIYLIDAMNCDRERWLAFAEAANRYREKKERT